MLEHAVVEAVAHVLGDDQRLWRVGRQETQKRQEGSVGWLAGAVASEARAGQRTALVSPTKVRNMRTTGTSAY